MSKIKIYYDKDDAAECLHHEEPYDVIVELLEESDGPQMDEDVTVYEYSPIEINEYSFRVLEDLLEMLDEEYGNEYSDAFEPTEEMKKAEKAFMKVMKEEYDPESYEQTGSETKTWRMWLEQFGLEDDDD